MAESGDFESQCLPREQSNWQSKVIFCVKFSPTIHYRVRKLGLLKRGHELIDSKDSNKKRKGQ